jgi:Phosphotransferase enzyme family
VIAAERDARLALVRRADWRFLLPQTRPARVAVLGAADDELLRALRETMGDVTLLASAADGSGTYDLVVVSGGDALAGADTLVAPGGALYWETPRELPLAAARAAFAGTGLADIRAHWHYPDFASCREIVPLDDDAVLGHVLRGGSHGVKGELRRVAARGLCRFGHLEMVARHRSLLAIRPGGHDAPATPGETLRQAVASHGQAGSLLVKTPRFRASGHVLLFAFPPRASEPSQVAKMPRLPGDPTLEREVACLRALEAASTRGVPRVQVCDTIGGVRTLVETVVPGRPLHPSRLRRGARPLLAAGVDWIADLHHATQQDRLPAREWGDRFVRDPLELLALTLTTPEDVALLERTRELLEPLRNRSLPTVFEHGDIGAPNLLLDEAGGFGVVDWELGLPEGLLAADLFFFLGFAAIAREGADEPTGFTRAFDRAFFGVGAWAARWIDRYSGRVRLPMEIRRPLFVLCAARTVAGTIARLRDENDAAPADPAFAGWLRTERSAVLWRDAVRRYEELTLTAEAGR